uniref:Uncharacterized protein n=1 Tax=Siphoviridae sp. ctmYS12 TaxID=2825652 RepID=A0A8S5P873_9CAUD|nr:MAG TPA: hypothetical protein [Siphoviridae sp. ctmYS12]
MRTILLRFFILSTVWANYIMGIRSIIVLLIM